MIILGLDLSIAKTGICLIDAHVKHHTVDVIRTRPQDSLESRLAAIRDGIKNHGDGHTAFASLAVIEEPFQHPKNKKGQISLHALYGVVRLMLYEHGIPIEWVTPSELKAWTAGNGNASKDTMIRAVNTRWHLSLTDDNEADAVALAMYGLEKYRQASR